MRFLQAFPKEGYLTLSRRRISIAAFNNMPQKSVHTAWRFFSRRKCGSVSKLYNSTGKACIRQKETMSL